MTPEEISKIAFRLYPHLVRSHDGETGESIAERIKGIQRGLLPEDEFAATVSWLGNSAGIYRIDQTPMPLPSPAETMRAPDFIAFPIVAGKTIPVLIEVKSKDEKHLDWSEKYLTSLRRFAECVGLPLLVAWKFQNIWTLVDHRHFEKNVTGYRLSLDKAFREDLFCVLFRNLRIQLNPDMELVFTMKILDEVPGEAGTLLPEGWIKMEISKVGFYLAGTEVKYHDNHQFNLFITGADDSEPRRSGKQECQQVFRPLPDQGFTLSNVLVSQLSLQYAGEESLDWHKILMQPFPSSGREFRQSLQAAIDKNFVRYVLDIIPNTWPDFLPAKEIVMADRS